MPDYGVEESAVETLKPLAEALAAAPDAAARAALYARLPEQSAERMALSLMLIERLAGPVAVEMMAEAARREPESAEALNGLGSTYRKLGRFRESVECFELALELRPDNLRLRFNLALAVMTLGDLERGWPLYEVGRKLLDNRGDALRRYPFPEWQGEPLQGKAIYLWGEQGIGDVILYGSMIGELQAAGAQVALECDGRLKTLLERSFPGLMVVVEGPFGDLGLDLSAFDCHAPLGSIGRFLRPDLESFPPARAFLKPDPQRLKTCRAALAGLGDGRKIGISWGSRSASYQAKATHLADWRPILTLPEVRFVNLQYGEVGADLEAVKQAYGVEIHDPPEIDKTHDIDGLTALAAACDLVITASNVTTHLAGGVGRPVFQLLPPECIWYWFAKREDSPWYPALRNFRAETPFVWSDALEATAGAVSALPVKHVSRARLRRPARRRRAARG